MNQFRSDVAALLNGNYSPSDTVITQDETIPVEPQKPAQEAQEKPQTESVVYDMKTLRKGSQGMQVMVLQYILNAKGYEAGKEDGIFGNNTLAAVKAFQKAYGLSVDGVVGKNTWTKLLA